MMQASDGNFYIAQPNGGNFPACGPGCGSILKMTPAGVVTRPSIFRRFGWGRAVDRIVEGGDGNLYGVATTGGSATECQGTSPPGCGTIFKITPTGDFSVIHTFNGTEGSYPIQLTIGSNGNFYFVSLDESSTG